MTTTDVVIETAPLLESERPVGLALNAGSIAPLPPGTARVLAAGTRSA